MDAKKILIVEDDPMISEIYQKKFEEAGFEVSAADSGEAAVNFLKKDRADLMMLDLIMPKMDGYEVIKNVRNVLGNNEVKIFVFSNLSQKEDQDKAMKLGANGFIVKSNYTPTSLVQEVTRLLNQYGEAKKNEMRQSQSQTQNENGDQDDNGGKKKKILLIEDEEIFLEMFGEKLRRDGYEVETADNGAWGIKEAFKKKFDIFIIDMVMPAMTGDEIVEKLKSDEHTKNIPIIVISASVDRDIEKKVKEMGVDEFFVKTQIIPSELSKKVEELIGQA